jgi:uncharacterized protein (DUF1684 family)
MTELARCRPLLLLFLTLMAAITAPAATTAAAGGSAAPAAPAATAPAAATSATAAGPADAWAPPPLPAYRQAIESWRSERQAALTSDNGWLTVVGLFWMHEGENRFGSDPANPVVLPAGRAPALAGSLVVHGGQVTLHAEPGSGITSDGKPVPAEMPLGADATGKPTVLQIGSVTFFVVQRGDRLGVRVKDSKSAALAAFHGLDSFPVDPSWRLVARFEPRAQPTSITITNILGMVQQQPSPGVVVFEAGGKTWRLDALLDSDDGSLFLIFADQTNGHGTYPSGRFLSTEPPRDGRVVVDFNKAVNPPCAFTQFATCPLPPPQNRLATAVTAGEKYSAPHS